MAGEVSGGGEGLGPPVELSVAEHVGTIALARAQRRNVLDEEMAEALREAAGRLAGAEEVRCVVLTGTDDAFAAGADIELIAERSSAELLAYNAVLRAAVDALAALPVPTIAAVNGHAVGGGLELALACTMRVASERARLGLPEARLGIIPATGGLARLPRLIGASAAARLLLTGELVRGEEALRLGLVDLSVVPEEVLPRARELAARVAGIAPLSARAILDSLRTDALLDIDAANHRAEKRLAAVLDSSDRREGAAAFLERREPRFEGS